MSVSKIDMRRIEICPFHKHVSVKCAPFYIENTTEFDQYIQYICECHREEKSPQKRIKEVSV